jgi:hypothetical protein
MLDGAQTSLKTFGPVRRHRGSNSCQKFGYRMLLDKGPIGYDDFVIVIIVIVFMLFLLFFFFFFLLFVIVIIIVVILPHGDAANNQSLF